MNKKKMLKAIIDEVNQEIHDQAQHGKYAAALANEGYAGGYRQALVDMDLISAGVWPNSQFAQRARWKEEDR